MTPAFLATTTALILAAAGASFQLFDSNPTPTQSTAVSIAPSTEHNAAAANNQEQNTAAAEGDSKTKRTVVRMRVGTNSNEQNRDIVREVTIEENGVHVVALKADADIFASLGLQPAAVQSICTGLNDAERVTNCSDGSVESSVKVCMIKDGATNEVVFMEKKGPMPVMFTSADGRGRVVESKKSSCSNPNRLVPVAAEGCGTNVIMWFEPNEEFVQSLPGELSTDLEHVIELDVEREIINAKKQLDAAHRELSRSEELTDFFNVLKVYQAQRVGIECDKQDSDEIEFNYSDVDSDSNTTDIVERLYKIVDGDSALSMSLRSLRISEHDFNIPQLNIKSIEIDSLINSRYGFLDSISLNNDSVMHWINSEDGSSLERRVIQFEQNIKYVTDSSDAEPVKIGTRKIRVEVSPNLRRRFIIISTSTTDRDKSSASLPITSLQETRTSEGVVNSTMLFPNPSSDGSATLSFVLDQPRSVSVSLLNLNGETVAELAQGLSLGVGPQSINVNATNQAAGMYLIALTTEQGERVIQRFIVQ